MDAKALLRTALQKAHVAVLADQEKNNQAAMEAYTEALLLLDQVLISVDRDEDKMRIQQIYDTYSDRIRSLHLLSPKPDSTDLYHTFNDTPSPKPVETVDEQTPLDWLSRPANRKYSNRSLRSPTSPRQRSASPTTDVTRLPRKSTTARSLHGPEDSPTPTQSRSTPNSRNSVKPEDAFTPLPPPRRKPSMASRARSPSPMRQHAALHTISPPPTHSPPPPPTSLHLITQPSLPPPTVPLPSIPTSVSEPNISLEPTDHHIIEEEEIVTPASQPRSISSSSSIDSLQVSTTPSSHQTTPVLEKETIQVNQDIVQLSTLPEERNTAVNLVTATTLLENKVNRIVPPQRNVSLLQNSAMSYSASLPIPQKNPINEETSASPKSLPVLQRTSSVQTFPSVFGRSTNSVLVRSGSIPSRSASQSYRPSMAPLDKIFVHPTEPIAKQPLAKGSPQQALDALDSDVLPAPVNLPVPGTPLYLFKSLESSMTQGAYISQRLYVPKKLWHQPNIRLPSIEAKLNAIETLLPQLARLELWAEMTDLQASMRQVDALASLLDSLQTMLTKKLGLKKAHESVDLDTNSLSRRGDRDSVMGSLTDAGSGTGGRKQLSAWGSRLSKSIKFTSAKSDDMYQQYIDALLKLFQASHVLDTWMSHYNNAKSQANAPDAQCDKMLQKLRKVCDSLDTIIGGFVVRDLAILLGKWMKRGSTWVGD